MSVILKNKEDWENYAKNFGVKIYSYVKSPDSYPCIAQAVEYDGVSQADVHFFFVYLEDAIELIHARNKEVYQLFAETNEISKEENG